MEVMYTVKRSPLTTHAVIILLLAIFLSGCSDNPVTPTENSQQDPSAGINSANSAHHQCLGYYQFIFDPDTVEFDIVPQRAGHLHLNVVNILNATMGVVAAGVPSQHDPPNGLFVFDISLTHPFGAKPNLAGFDVKGILITPGTSGNGTRSYAGAGETRLENADAYTRWWNPSEFPQAGMFGYTTGNLANSPPGPLTSEINPYKYFADALGPNEGMGGVFTEPVESDFGRGVFRAGSTNTRRYKIRFPMDPGPQIVFGYAVDASWAPPTINPPNEVPDDFPINANQPEAFHVALAQKANSLYFDTESGMTGGILRLQVNVHDWQGFVADDIPSEVGNILAYCPQLWSGGASFDPLDTTAYNARYTTDLSAQVTPLAAGEEILAVRVGSKGGPEYDQGVGPAPPESYVATWQLQKLLVTDPSCVSDSNNSLGEAVEIGLTGQVVAELCDSVDTEDWYSFEIPVGSEISGEARWYSDADTCELVLYNAYGDYLRDSYTAAAGLYVLETDDLFLPPGTYYLQALATQVGNPPPAGILYLLETEFELTNVEPSNPVNITPGDLDCAATWVGTDPDDDTYLLMAGKAGTWGVRTGGGFLLQSRTYDGIETEPGFFYPYMYIWDYPGGGVVDLVDYSNINTPVEHDAVLTFSGVVESMTMNSTHLYIAVADGPNTSIHIYDYVTDPTSPIFLDEALINDDAMQLDLLDAEGANTTLVQMGSTVMTLWDVEDPSAVTALDSDIMINATNIDMCVVGDFILKTYIDQMPDGYLGIQKFDPVGGFEPWGYRVLSGFGYSVSGQGTYAYVANGDQGIDVISFMVKNAPQLLSTVPVTSTAWYIHATESLLYSVQEGPGVVMYDRSSPALPVYQNETLCLNNPFDVAFLPNDFAVFVEGVTGYGTMSTVYLRDPGGPNLLHEFQLDDYSWQIESYDNLVAVGSTSANKIWIYQFSSNPIVYSEIYNDNLAANISAMKMTNKGLYVAMQNGKVQVYDTSFEYAPAILKQPDMTLHDSNPACDLVIDSVKNFAYVPLDGAPEFDVYSTTDPYNWTYLTYRDTTYNTVDADMFNDYVYILTADNLQIFDVGPNPASPAFTGLVSMPYPGSISFLDVPGQYAYVTDLGSVVWVASVYPPDAPAMTGHTIPDFDGVTTGIRIYENLLIQMKKTYGPQIYELY